jgi:hypothetical protein
MTVKIEISGIKQTKKYLARKNKDATKKVSIGMSKVAIFMQGEVKSSIAGRRNEPTSVDTGRFLNSVEFSAGKNDAVIFTQVPYSKFLEYGTSRMRARKHFRNSKFRNEHKIKNMLRNHIKKI